MIYINDFLNSLNIAYSNVLATSDAQRQRLHQDMACFYYNDYEEITRILKEETLNNPYSQETLDNIRFRHIDMIRKTVRKLTAGVYQQRPIRKLVLNEEETNPELLDMLLEQCKFHQVVKDCYEASQFFNTVFAMPVYDHEKNKLKVEVILPNDVVVHERELDYLEFDAIAIRSTIGKEICYAVWTEKEHFIKSGETKKPIETNPDMVNPFTPVIPISVLRLRKGWDFYGEPNWNLYNAQKELTINNTEMKLAEQKTLHQAWLAINMQLGNNETISSGKILQRNNVRDDEATPTLESVTSNYDFQSIRENTDYLLTQLAISEGLNASSVSQDVNDMSGIAKIVDNAELEERRLDNLDLLYAFEVDLLNKCRMVWNKYSNEKLNDKAVFEVEFIEDPQTETISDKAARREMEKKYGIANEIDFVIEDKELASREEALEHIQLRQKELTQLNTTSVAQKETVDRDGLSPDENNEEI
jgi:hypothetical protein